MLTTVRIGGIEVVSLLDGVEDLDDPDILDPRHGPSDPVWEPSRALYPAPGRLLGSLAETGTSAHDVDVVVLTHVHETDRRAGRISWQPIG